MTLIDWQIIGKGDGSGDLVPFLFANLDIVLRRAHEDDLIRRYFDAMQAQGVGYEHFEDQMIGLRYGLMFWMIAWGNTCVTAVSVNERAEALFEHVMARITSAAKDHRPWELIGDYSWSPTHLS